jgi:hypothetical protein
MVLFTFDHFWCGVARTATGSFESFTLVIKVTQTEVNNFDAVVVIEQQVLRLQVSMADAQFVDILDT